MRLIIPKKLIDEVREKERVRDEENKEWVCPRCLETTTVVGALSSYDNKTKICNKCKYAEDVDDYLSRVFDTREIIGVVDFIDGLRHKKLTEGKKYLLVDKKTKHIVGALTVDKTPEKYVSETVYYGKDGDK
jgi:hypothetical protein